MCGRFTLTRMPGEWAELLDMPGFDPPKPRYNVAPGQYILTILRDPEVSHPILQLLFWGLLPAWVKDPKDATRPINARAETVAEKPYFRAAIRHRRCLIPADGFFEWSGTGAQRRPIYFQMADERPFAMAGIWERWQGPRDELIDSCTILTTTPNPVVKPHHHRMPVILDPAHFKTWLDPSEQSARAVAHLLAPYPPATMKATPVSRRVNSAARDDAGCVQRELDGL
ncbi:MAG: SOS response-associated peptidase [Verrucomicrobia bacterium]|nr:SOS response-associated peptidase [Verrucomicrobiota bacterium]